MLTSFYLIQLARLSNNIQQVSNKHPTSIQLYYYNYITVYRSLIYIYISILYNKPTGQLLAKLYHTLPNLAKLAKLSNCCYS